jgi:hypothetical protein
VVPPQRPRCNSIFRLPTPTVPPHPAPPRTLRAKPQLQPSKSYPCEGGHKALESCGSTRICRISGCAQCTIRRTEGAAGANLLSNATAMTATHFPDFMSHFIAARLRTSQPNHGLRPHAGVTQLSSAQPPTVTPVAMRTRFEPSAFMVKMSRPPSVLSRSLAKTICVPSGE